MDDIANEDRWSSSHPFLKVLIEEPRIYWKSLVLSIIGFYFFYRLCRVIYYGWRWNITEADPAWLKYITDLEEKAKSQRAYTLDEVFEPCKGTLKERIMGRKCLCGRKMRDNWEYQGEFSTLTMEQIAAKEEAELENENMLK